MSFVSWFQHREFGIIVLTVLVSNAVKTFAKQTNQNVISPVIYKCMSNFGKPFSSEVKQFRFELFFLNFLEFLLTIFLIYTISKILFKKESFKPVLI